MLKSIADARKDDYYSTLTNCRGKAKTMKVTGERFVPGKMFKHSEVEHMHRYSAVQNILRDKVVLDAACGTGYGSNMIAEVANMVYGVDISHEAIEYATNTFCELKNVKYVQADIMKLPFNDEMFDAVVSFETIEHVGEKIQNKFLEEIRRVLKPDGILVMSTPNKEIYTVRAGNAATEWHVKEFFEDEFDRFLRSKFRNVKYYQQYISKASYLLESEVQDVANLKNIDREKRGKFIVAIASNCNVFPCDVKNLNSIYYYPDSYAELDEVCQVFYCFEGDEKFCEKSSEIVEVSSRQKEIRLELEFEEYRKIQRVRIDPLNNSCAIRNFAAVVLTGDEQLYPQNLINNSDNVTGEVYYFYHRDPQYIIEFKEPVHIEKLIISFYVEHYNIDAYTFMNQKLLSLENILNKERKDYKLSFSLYEQKIEMMSSVLAAINKERESIERERVAIISEREHFAKECTEINRERESIERERVAIVSEREYIAQEHNAINDERRNIVEEIDLLKQTKEMLDKKKDKLNLEYEQFRQELQSFYNRPLGKRIIQAFVKK